MSAAFWQPVELVINNYAELVETIEGVLDLAKTINRQFAWRGQVNSTWALHSSLYRRTALTSAKNPVEAEIAKRGARGSGLANGHKLSLCGQLRRPTAQSVSVCPARQTAETVSGCQT